jgi:hypothetical protein
MLGEELGHSETNARRSWIKSVAAGLSFLKGEMKCPNAFLLPSAFVLLCWQVADLAARVIQQTWDLTVAGLAPVGLLR